MVLKVYDITRRLLFIVVYTVFFIVQVFSSIGNIAAGKALNSSHSIHKATICHQSCLTSSESSGAKKSEIRLNKRFHPESIPGISYSVTAIFPRLIVIVKPLKPEDYLRISLVLTDSLRGPPVVA